MPPEIHTHAVYGFSERLDWTTLHFVQPIADIRVCSACGVVARKTAFLACRHVLCEPCYEQWNSRASHVCFLDGDLCPENEIHWMEFPVEKMEKSKVSCFNRKNGCEIITDVSRIADHFHRDCTYHSTSCPVCSSTVLRKDIIAHLESQCVNYVLRIRSVTSPTDGLSKDLKDIRRSVRGEEMPFRSASDNDVLAVTSLREIAQNGAGNVDHLSETSAEILRLSQVTRQASGEVESSSEDGVNEIEDMKACKDSLCAELDEIERVAAEVGSRETTNQQETREHEKCTDKLQAMNRKIRGISNILGGFVCEILPEVDEAEREAINDLSERLIYYTYSKLLSSCSPDSLPLQARARVFVNTKKVPAKIVWCVSAWRTLRNEIKANSLLSAETTILFEATYGILLILQKDVKGKQGFRFVVNLCGAKATLPKSVTLLFMNKQKGAAKYVINLEARDKCDPSGGFESPSLTINYLKHNGIILGDVLKVCLTFSY